MYRVVQVQNTNDIFLNASKCTSNSHIIIIARGLAGPWGCRVSQFITRDDRKISETPGLCTQFRDSDTYRIYYAVDTN